jgi:hypothetical protein
MDLAVADLVQRFHTGEIGPPLMQRGNCGRCSSSQLPECRAWWQFCKVLPKYRPAAALA